MTVFPGKTLWKETTLEGLGLHSSEPSSVTIGPGERGIVFHTNGQTILAAHTSVTDTQRGTTLGPAATVEHFMSALAALEITDAEIELSSGEMPALDGSALPFYEAICEAGIVECASLTVADLSQTVEVSENGSRIEITPGSGRWKYVFQSDARWPYHQEAEVEDVCQDFGPQIAPARTWAFEEEVAQLRANGFGLGLDAHSALVIGSAGYINEPRFPNEPARHKLLDLIGDLYLAGIPISRLNVVSHRAGHRLNVLAARELSRAVGASSELDRMKPPRRFGS